MDGGSAAAWFRSVPRQSDKVGVGSRATDPCRSEVEQLCDGVPRRELADPIDSDLLPLTEECLAPVLHSPQGRPRDVNVAIPTPAGSFDESPAFGPSKCIGKPFAWTIVWRGGVEPEPEITEVT